jgi:hypothetical protein
MSDSDQDFTLEVQSPPHDRILRAAAQRAGVGNIAYHIARAARADLRAGRATLDADGFVQPVDTTDSAHTIETQETPYDHLFQPTEST